ncbi:MAG: hypothetical protein IKW76_07770, partial [Clostridia bacterium]|nr:hypothetical protein [Clostridia bacterium]
MKEHVHPQYISELNAFHRWLGTHCLGANAILMWFMLIGLVNAGGWEEWVQIDNTRLMCLVRTKTEKTAMRARKELIDAGLLVYEKGRRGQCGRYKLCWLSCGDTDSADRYDSQN